MRRKSAFSCIAAALALCLLCVPALAVDMDYDGPVDSFTGEAINSDTDTYSDRVQVSDGVTYDRTQGMYLYTVGSNARVASSVVDGQIVQEPVSLSPDQQLSVTLYKDGEALPEQDLGHISDSGDYVLNYTATSGQVSRVLSFSIVGEQTGRLTGYTMPAGFIITGATLDGGNIAWDRSYVNLSGEGRCVVNYKCARNGVGYKLDVILDHTAPTLALEAVENGRARGPVSLADLEEGANIAVTLNGTQIAVGDTLTKRGDYKVWVWDQAGNMTTYEFTILTYLDVNSYVFLGLIVGVIAAVGIYLLLSRRRLKIR